MTPEDILERLIPFLERCIDSPDCSIRRDATAFYGEICDYLETEHDEVTEPVCTDRDRDRGDRTVPVCQIPANQPRPLEGAA